ncbi:MAG: BrxA/BrxB family bacilliredoxin [Pyrinomonadaceae bacterium]|nr:BrxA/BrxB family bacilliredoxin [Pyrinomonadaceae bacterium]
MPYPEMFIAPMRQDLTNIGVEETRKPEQVEEALNKSDGTVLVVVNSVCGCAAGKARPGVALALQHERRPDRSITVFAGADIDATDTARSYFAPYRPSSPQIALFKDGQLVYMMERHQIEGKFAEQIARDLTQAFDEHCAPVAAK